MMRLGVVTLIWSENFGTDDLWILRRARELGSDVIDIAIVDPFAFPTEAVRRAVQETGIEVVLTHSLGPQNNPISPDPEIRSNGTRALKRCVEIGNALGVKLLSGVTYAAWGYKTGKPRTQQEWDWSVKHMREVCRFAAEAGTLNVAVEVINRYVTHFLNVSSDGVRYCEDVGLPNIKVHLDSFHMMIEENSFEEAIRRCGNRYLGYFHACESHRGIPGTGMVPWRGMLRELAAINYQGPLVIEAYDPGFDRISVNSCTWRRFAATGEEFAERGLQFLRGLLQSP
jgi:D-psicose/D-tagatose/L-ribulose 3-epimerase